MLHPKKKSEKVKDFLDEQSENVEDVKAETEEVKSPIPEKTELEKSQEYVENAFTKLQEQFADIQRMIGEITSDYAEQKKVLQKLVKSDEKVHEKVSKEEFSKILGSVIPLQAENKKEFGENLLDQFDDALKNAGYTHSDLSHEQNVEFKRYITKLEEDFK